MKPGTPGFLGARLKEGREARGLSQTAMAELLDLSRQAISQYESGTITPAPAVMQAIADKLRLPVAFFRTQPELPDLGTIFYRSLAPAVKHARTRAERRYAWLHQVVRFVKLYVDLPTVDVPDLGFPEDPQHIDFDNVEDAANEIRRRWQLGDGPVGNLVLTLENHGVLVTRGELGALELDAFSSWAEDTPGIFLGSDKASAVRSRYDAAHELGHLVLHRRLDNARLERKGDFKLVEQQAHRFAGAFLLPAATFSRDIMLGSLEEMVAIKPKWGASLGTMIHRGQDLGLVSAEGAVRLYRSRARRGWNRWEPLDDELPVEQPRLLRRSFELMLSEGGLSKTEILEALPLVATDIEDLANMPRGHLSEGPVPIQLSVRRANSGRSENSGTVSQFSDRSTRQ